MDYRIKKTGSLHSRRQKLFWRATGSSNSLPPPPSVTVVMAGKCSMESSAGWASGKSPSPALFSLPPYGDFLSVSQMHTEHQTLHRGLQMKGQENKGDPQTGRNILKYF